MTPPFDQELKSLYKQILKHNCKVVGQIEDGTAIRVVFLDPDPGFVGAYGYDLNTLYRNDILYASASPAVTNEISWMISAHYLGIPHRRQVKVKDPYSKWSDLKGGIALWLIRQFKRQGFIRWFVMKVLRP